MTPTRRRPVPPHRRTAAKKPSGGGFWRGLLLMLLGFTGGVGAAAYFAAYINKLPLPLTPPPTRGGNQTEEALQRGRRDALEFHDTLRQRQELTVPVDVPEEEATPAATRQFVYYLQLGAFASRDAAEELRGQVALSGAQASLKEGKNSAGEEIFRVWMGPYSNEEDAESARATVLLQGHHDIQLLKLAGSSNSANSNEAN